MKKWTFATVVSFLPKKNKSNNKPLTSLPSFEVSTVFHLNPRAALKLPPPSGHCGGSSGTEGPSTPARDSPATERWQTMEDSSGMNGGTQHSKLLSLGIVLPQHIMLTQGS